MGLATIRGQMRQLQHSGPPLTRAQQVEMDRQTVEKIRAACGTRPEQVAAWIEETGRSERAFDRRSRELRLSS